MKHSSRLHSVSSQISAKQKQNYERFVGKAQPEVIFNKHFDFLRIHEIELDRKIKTLTKISSYRLLRLLGEAEISNNSNNIGQVMAQSYAYCTFFSVSLKSALVW